MKLVPKLALAFVAGTSIIVLANGYFRIEREVAVLRADRIRDHALIARSLGAALAAVWRSDGRTEALAVIDASNARGGAVRARWVDDATEADVPTHVDVASLASGDVLTVNAPTPRGIETRFTYLAIAIDGTRRGALEISESLIAEHRAARRILADTGIAALALALVNACLSVMLGVWLIGRPVRALADKARRIGQGDLSGPVHLKQRDELGELAGEMNAMCDRLVEARSLVAQETAARIAALEQLRHADRLVTVGKLASGVAHELGTPLNVVSARAAMLADGEVTPADAASYARVIMVAAEKMTAIIRQLLEFARRRGPQKATCDLRALATTTLDMLRSLAAKRDVTLELVHGPPISANVDAGQLQQALTNLVMNAVQASRGPGLVSVSLAKVRAAPPADQGGAEAEYVCVRVKDDGEGIAQEHIAHVFEPFFTTKNVGEGTGLGLSVTYGIARDHGGFIAVESTPGERTVFSLYLPDEALS